MPDRDTCTSAFCDAESAPDSGLCPKHRDERAAAAAKRAAARAAAPPIPRVAVAARPPRRKRGRPRTRPDTPDIERTRARAREAYRRARLAARSS
jgi:hypothetical protein